MIHNGKFFDSFGQVLVKHPNIDLTDLFSKGQIKSKRWLINELIKLNLNLGVVFICAGWYSLLATFILDSPLNVKFVRSFDIDDSCVDVAETLNKFWVIQEWKFKASTFDICNFSYPLTYKTKRPDGSLVTLTEMPDTIINTSCEHINNFNQWYNNIPSGKLLVLQGNNYFELPDHVNCSNSLEAFSNNTPMSTVLYEGELELLKYKRFMKIGIK
jgi:hypothetical protein